MHLKETQDQQDLLVLQGQAAVLDQQGLRVLMVRLDLQDQQDPPVLQALLVVTVQTVLPDLLDLLPDSARLAHQQAQ